MNIALPLEIENRISAADARLHIAIGLFAGDDVTLAQAAEIAGMSRPAFLQELGKRKIPVHYGPDEFGRGRYRCTEDGRVANEPVTAAYM